jgi:hypothetical protein
MIREKFRRRNQRMSQLLFFLPEMPNENCISISHAKTRNGKPSNKAISENLIRISGEIYEERNSFITACPQIP